MEKFLFPQMPIMGFFGTPLFNQLDDDERLVAEIKKNGWRMEAVTHGGLLLWSRHRLVMPDFTNSKLLGIKKCLKKMMPNFSMLDGELLDRRETPGNIKDVYYVFDILYWNKKPIWMLPFKERRKLLERVITPNENIWLPKQFATNRRQLYLNAVKDGDEGIVFKRIDRKYDVGLGASKCTPSWIKVRKEIKQKEGYCYG